MQKRWVYNYTDKKRIKYITQQYKISDLLAKVLLNRNISEVDLDIFLEPTRNNLHNPYLLTDIKEAIDRVLEAKEKKKK